MDLLHPQLLSKQQLLDIFRQRNFTIPRLEESTRDELIQLYTKHLLPQPRRGTPGSGSSADGPQDVEMKDCSPPSNGDTSRKRNNVRQRIVYGDSPAVDNVSHGMKKIRLISGSLATNIGANGTGTRSFAEQHNSSSVVVKRPLEISPGKATAVSATASNSTSKRQKITWP
uniref:(northern house mosquito) hypothetical protein n=1 Tax=Culex pipiens TaxID=7175 RepID=A0A8D8H5P4_CULPI